MVNAMGEADDVNGSTGERGSEWPRGRGRSFQEEARQCFPGRECRRGRKAWLCGLALLVWEGAQELSQVTLLLMD